MDSEKVNTRRPASSLTWRDGNPSGFGKLDAATGAAVGVVAMNDARGAGAEAPLGTSVCVDAGADLPSHPQRSAARTEARDTIGRCMDVPSLPRMSLVGEKKAKEK
jgi:hypothetical protein